MPAGKPNLVRFEHAFQRLPDSSGSARGHPVELPRSERFHPLDPDCSHTADPIYERARDSALRSECVVRDFEEESEVFQEFLVVRVPVPVQKIGPPRARDRDAEGGKVRFNVTEPDAESTLRLHHVKENPHACAQR